MWDLKPWDNDGAADWYGSLMDTTNLRNAWLEGINSDPADEPEIIRAAAGLFIFLGRVYIWPIERYDEDLELAIANLAKVKETAEYKDLPELIDLIDGELNELISRRVPINKEKRAAEADARSKRWWKIW